jgi:hypothetical protein
VLIITFILAGRRRAVYICTRVRAGVGIWASSVFVLPLIPVDERTIEYPETHAELNRRVSLVEVERTQVPKGFLPVVDLNG